MTVQDAYTQWSETYDHDKNLTRDLDAYVTRITLGNQRYQSIIEAGCGTGKNTVFLAEVGEQVIALDFSEGMMAQAREKVQQTNVTFLFADLIQTWPCADASADLLVCNLVLEHIDNLAPIFAEAARVLIDGGQFFLCELHPFRQYQGTQAYFQQGTEATLIPAFVHHISDFTRAGESNGFAMTQLREWWHEADENKPPRLVSFLFTRRATGFDNA